MPEARIGLTVSHLPTSYPFYLTALKPLGYRYICKVGTQIGLGEYEAVFFLDEDSSGQKDRQSHITFQAKTRKEVEAFHSAALGAGGTSSVCPSVREQDTGYYSAEILDLDKNVVEVAHHAEHKGMSSAPRDEHEPYSSRLTEYTPASNSEGSPFEKIVRSITRITKTTTHETSPSSSSPSPSPATPQSDNSDPNSKALVGTLLGAAAGAAIAYCLTKESSTKSNDSRQSANDRGANLRHTTQASQSVHNKRGDISYTSEPESQSTVRPRPRAIRASRSERAEAQANNPFCRSSKPYAIEPPDTVVSDTPSIKSHRKSKQALAIEPPLKARTVLSEATSKSTRKSHRTKPATFTIEEVNSDSDKDHIDDKVSKAVSSRSHKSKSKSKKKPLAIKAPPPSSAELSKAESRHTHRSKSEQLVNDEAPEPEVEEAPSMISTTSRRSHRHPRAITSRPHRGPAEPVSPRDPVYPDANYVTMATPATPASKGPTMRTTYTTTIKTYHPPAADYPLPESRKTSAYSYDPRDLPLPETRRGSTYTSHTHETRNIPLPASRHGSNYTHQAYTDPRDIALPNSVMGGSRYTQEPHEIELPPSAHHSSRRRSSHHSGSGSGSGSHHSRRSHHSHRSHRSSRSSRDEAVDPASVHSPSTVRPPAQVTPPRGSAPWNTFLSAQARSPPPRSAVSGTSTIKPLSQRNMRKAMTDIGFDDQDTVLPEDSISQAGATRHTTSHRSGNHPRSARRPSGSSRVSMPRSLGRVLGVVQG